MVYPLLNIRNKNQGTGTDVTTREEAINVYYTYALNVYKEDVSFDEIKASFEDSIGYLNMFIYYFGLSSVDTLLVSDDDLVLKSVDGVLYTNTESDLLSLYEDAQSILYACPRGKTSIEITEPIVEIGPCAFMVSSLESIVIPDTVETLGERAFTGSPKLKNITFSDKIKEISERCFWGCIALTELILPENIETIAEDAFCWCVKLTDITLNEGLKKIESDAFDYCYSLREIVIPSTVRELSSSSFSCDFLAEIELKANFSYNDVNNAFRNIGHHFVDDFYTIEEYAEIEAINLCLNNFFMVKYTKEEILEYEKKYMEFQEKENSYDEPYELYATITAHDYGDISEISSIDGAVVTFVPYENHNVTVLEDGVAATCANDGRTNSVVCDVCGTIDGAKAIPSLPHTYGDDDICDECQYERTLVQSGNCGKNGDNLTWQLYDEGTLVISGTDEMATYDSWSTLPPWSSYKDSIKHLDIKEGVTSVGSCAFYNCRSLTDVSFSDTVKTIGSNAFEYCYQLSSVNLGAGVKTIEYDAFYNCALTSVTIPAATTTIGSSAFYCDTLTAFEVAEGNKNFAAVDGVLYNNDITAIVQYPAEKKDAEYVVPDTVTGISSGVYLFSML